MTQIEKDIKEEFILFREAASREIYLFNPAMFENYVKFIKAHPLFVEEIFLKEDEKKQEIKIVKKPTPSLKERKKTSNDIMQIAKRVGNDEFYTRPEDVEKELSMYAQSIWKDKVLYCNCDSFVNYGEQKVSAFALYFLKNFKEFKLKKLICTHYASKVDLFNAGSNGYIFTKDGFSEFGNKEYPKGYDGSFAHPTSIKILNEEADIVCTNPPFSRGREY
jgi:hypothetical protein